MTEPQDPYGPDYVPYVPYVPRLPQQPYRPTAAPYGQPAPQMPPPQPPRGPYGQGAQQVPPYQQPALGGLYPPQLQEWPGQQPHPPAPVPPKKRSSTAKVVGIIAAVAVGLGVAGGITAAALNSNSGVAAGPGATPTTRAASPTPKSAAPALSAWWNGGAKDRSTAIGNDFNKVAQEAAASNYPGVQVACSQAQKDVKAAQASGQAPDAQAQALWAAAMASYAQASTDCITAVATQNKDLVLKASNEINAGNDSLRQLAARISQLGGK